MVNFQPYSEHKLKICSAIGTTPIEKMDEFKRIKSMFLYFSEDPDLGVSIPTNGLINNSYRNVLQTYVLFVSNFEMLQSCKR